MSVSKNYRSHPERLEPKKNGAVSTKNLPQSQNYLEISFRPETILKFASLVICGLIVLSTLSQLYLYLIPGYKYTKLISFFYVDKESNLPTFYSSLALLFCSVLLAIIAKSKYKNYDKYRHYWKFLSLIFLYLSIDENAKIHEMTAATVRSFLNVSGFLYYAWVIPAIILFSLFALIYLKFVLSLPKKIRFLFIFAAAIFVSGAVGIEMIEANFRLIEGKHNLTYAIMATVEETFEMVGIAIFMYALLKYLQQYIEPLKIRW